VHGTNLNLHLDRFLRRWAYVSARNISAFAHQSAAWFRLEPPPRLAAPCLHRLGVVVRREGLPAGVDAVWRMENGDYVVSVSAFSPGARANFTLWHEWFEVMAARPTFPTQLSEHQRERLADRYAAAITMPEDAVARMLQEFADSGDKTDVMAARFGVSVAAMRWRIREVAPRRAL
jgi:hypothetical protein